MAVTSPYAASPYTGTRAPDYGILTTGWTSAVEAFNTGLGGTLTLDALVAYHDNKGKENGEQLTEEQFYALGYGDADLLKWKPGMSKMGAEIRFRAALEQQVRQYKMQGSPVAGFVGGMVGSMAHPVDFAVGFAAPEFGFAKVASTTYRLGARQMGRVMSKGALAGFSQAAIETPVFYFSEPYLQSGMGEADALINLVSSPIAGGLLGGATTALRVKTNPLVTRKSRAALDLLIGDPKAAFHDPAKAWVKILQSDKTGKLPVKALNHAEMRRLLKKREWAPEDRDRFVRWMEDSGVDEYATTTRAKASEKANAEVLDSLDRPYVTVAKLSGKEGEELLESVGFLQRSGEEPRSLVTAGKRGKEFVGTGRKKAPADSETSSSLLQGSRYTSDQQKALADVFSEAFGVEVHFHPTLTASGRVLPDRPGILFIREGMNAKDTVKAAFHEFTHSLRLRDSRSYRKIVNLLTEGGEEILAFVREAQKEISEAYGPKWKELTPDRQMDEIVAETVGKLAEIPEFWRQLYRENPTVFQKLVQFLQKLVARLRKAPELRPMAEEVARILSMASKSHAVDPMWSVHGFGAKVFYRLEQRLFGEDSKSVKAALKYFDELAEATNGWKAFAPYGDGRWEPIDDIRLPKPVPVGSFQALFAEARGPTKKGAPRDTVIFWFNGEQIPPDATGRGYYDRMTTYRYTDGEMKSVEVRPKGEREISSIEPRRKKSEREILPPELERLGPDERMANPKEYYTFARKALLDKSRDSWVEKTDPGAWEQFKATGELPPEVQAAWESSKARADEVMYLDQLSAKELSEEARAAGLVGEVDEEMGFQKNWKASGQGPEDADLSGYRYAGEDVPFEDRALPLPDYEELVAKFRRRAFVEGKKYRAQLLDGFRKLLDDETVDPDDLASDMARFEALTDSQLFEVAAHVVEEVGAGNLGMRAKVFRDAEPLAIKRRRAEREAMVGKPEEDVVGGPFPNEIAGKTARAIDKALSAIEGKGESEDILDMTKQVSGSDVMDYILSLRDADNLSKEEQALLDGFNVRDALSEEESIYNALGSIMDGALDRPLTETGSWMAQKAKHAVSWVSEKAEKFTTTGYKHTGYDPKIQQVAEREALDFLRGDTVERLHKSLLNDLPPEDLAAIDYYMDPEAQKAGLPAPKASRLAPGTVQHIVKVRQMADSVRDAFKDGDAFESFEQFQLKLAAIHNWYPGLLGVEPKDGIRSSLVPLVQKRLAKKGATEEEVLAGLLAERRISRETYDAVGTLQKEYLERQGKPLSLPVALVVAAGNKDVVSVRFFQELHATRLRTGFPFPDCLDELLSHKAKIQENRAILQQRAIDKLRETHGKTPSLFRTFLDGNRRKDGFSGSALPAQKAGMQDRVMSLINNVSAKYPGLLDDFSKNGEVTERVVRYLASNRELQDVTEAEKALGDAIATAYNMQGSMLGQAGADINPLRGYVMRQLWAKAKNVSREDFMAAAEEAFDWSRIQQSRGGVDGEGNTNVWFVGSGDEAREAANRAAYLSELYDWVKEEGWKKDLDPEQSSFNLAKQSSYSRSVHILPEKLFEWDKEFGSGKPAANILSGLNRRADQIACVRNLGPDLDVTYREITSAFGDKWERRLSFDRATFQQVVGELDAPVDAELALRGRAIRDVENWTVLELSGINSILDVATSCNALRYHGVELGALNRKFVTNYMSAIKKGGKHHHVYLNSLGAGAQQLLTNFTNRLTGEADLNSRTGLLNNFLFTVNGMNRLTKAAQETAIQIMSAAIGEGKINPQRFSRYGLSPEDLAIVKSLAHEVEGLSGKHTSPADLRAAGYDDLAERLESFYHAFKEEAVLEPDPRSKAISRLGTKAGTWQGEIAREVMRYTGFPLAMINKTWRRVLNGYGEEAFWKTFTTWENRQAVETLSFVGSLLALGYFVTVLRDLASGREPMMLEDMSPSAMRRIIATSGMLGPLDMLFHEGKGPVDYLGPTAGLASDVVSGVFGEGSLGSTALRAAPFADLPFVGPAAKEVLTLVFGDALIELETAHERSKAWWAREYGSDPLLD